MSAFAGDDEQNSRDGDVAQQQPSAERLASASGQRRRPSRAERERQRATRRAASLRRKVERVRSSTASPSSAELSKQDLKVCLADCLADAEEILMARGHLPALITFRTASGRHEAMVPDFSSPEAKIFSGDAARVLAIALDAQVAVLWGEVWTVDGDLLDGVRPRDSDRRVEAVMINLEGRANGTIYQLSAIREIVRGPDGKPQALKPRDDFDSGELEVRGELTQWLPSFRPDARTQAEARALLEAHGVRGRRPHRA